MTLYLASNATCPFTVIVHCTGNLGQGTAGEEAQAHRNPNLHRAGTHVRLKGSVTSDERLTVTHIAFHYIKSYDNDVKQTGYSSGISPGILGKG